MAAVHRSDVFADVVADTTQSCSVDTASPRGASVRGPAGSGLLRRQRTSSDDQLPSLPSRTDQVSVNSDYIWIFVAVH